MNVRDVLDLMCVDTKYQFRFVQSKTNSEEKTICSFNVYDVETLQYLDNHVLALYIENNTLIIMI